MKTRRSWRNQNRLWKELAGKSVEHLKPAQQSPEKQEEMRKLMRDFWDKELKENN